MKKAILIISWIISGFFFVFAGFTIGKNSLIPGLFLLVIALLLYPPLDKRMSLITGKSIKIWLRISICLLLFIGYFISLFLSSARMPSIYRTLEYQSVLMEIYNEKLTQWPTIYESRFIETLYGKVHMIASGPEEAPPVRLLHAASLSAVSWLHNIDSLNRYFRTYAD